MRSSMCLTGMLLLGWGVWAGEPGPGLPGLAEKLGERATAELTDVLAQSTLDLKTGEAHRMLILQAALNIPESIDAVGMTHQLEITELIDGNGEDLLEASRRSGQLVFIGPRFYGSLTHTRPEGARGAIHVSNSLNGLPRIPERFTTVRGKAFLLLATRRVVTEVSPIRLGSLVEITPSLAVQIVHFKQEGQNLELRFVYDAERDVPFFNPNTDPPFVDAIKLIDDQGAEVPGRGGAPQQQEAEQVKGGPFKGEGHIVFTLPEGRTPASLKFEVVTEMEEREVEFVAHDVRMPVDE